MRLNHINIYYTIEKDLNEYIDVFSYEKSKLYRYNIRYNESIESIEYVKYGLLDCIKYEEKTIQIKNFCIVDELNLAGYFEDIFSGYNTFLSFKDMFEFVIEEVKAGKTDISESDIQDIIDIYPEKFI